MSASAAAALAGVEQPLASRDLGGGRWAYVVPLTFGRARLTIGPHYDEGVYDDGW